MESSLQCPVCTLFLHAGMDLQSHLDTHPKDQVIKALVNIAMPKQNDATYVTSNNQNATIAENAFPREVNQYLSEPSLHRQHQVLFGYSCSNRDFQEVPNQSATTRKFISNASPIIVSTIPAQASQVNHSQKFPPPPYRLIVTKSIIEKPAQTLASINIYNKLQAHQVGIISNPRNNAPCLSVQNDVNDAEVVSEGNVNEYSNQTNENMEFIDHCDEEYVVNEGDVTNSLDKHEYSEYENVDSLQDNQMNSVCYTNDDEPIEDIKHETQKQKKITEGLRVLSDVKLPATVDLLHLDCKFGESFKLDDVLRKRLKTDNTPIEVYDSADEESDPLAIGDCGKEFEMSNSAVDTNSSSNMTMKCEVDMVKTIKTEREVEQQLYHNQNADEVNVLF